jgi:hypothetical protein
MTTEKEAFEALGKAASKFFKLIFFILSAVFNPLRIKGKKAPPSQSMGQLEVLFEQTQTAYQDCGLTKIKPSDLAFFIIDEAEKRSGKPFPHSLVNPLYFITLDLAAAEGLLGLRDFSFDETWPASEQVMVTAYLKQLQERYGDIEEYMEVWAQSLIGAYVVLLKNLSALPSDQTDENGQLTFSLQVTDLLRDPKQTINDFVEQFSTQELERMGLFESVREQFNYNALVLSGIDPQNPGSKLPTLPKDAKLPAHKVAKQYFDGTVFKDFFVRKADVTLPLSARFEHMHILAGTGTGKTQLLQKLIGADLDAGHGMMVIDSQGDLIRKVRSLDVFDPVGGQYKDKLIVIDPEDIEYPPQLNIFAFSSSDMEGATLLEKEKLINQAIDLYVYLFGSLFGAELTSKQSVVFRYIAKLMFEIPDANILTLVDLLNNGAKYKPFFAKLDGASQHFFKTEFFSSSFGATKKQILSRLYAVLSNGTIERMFSNSNNAINLFDAMNSGCVVLVNTAKDLLQEEGSAILGRFFIALASQAVLSRQTILEENRLPFFVYVDEAQEYFDAKIESMLAQARKYRVGFVLSHQSLSQLGGIKNSVLANTSIKAVAGVSHADAQAMAYEMHCSTDDIMALGKSDKSSDFALYVKHLLQTPITARVEFGLLESRPRLTASSLDTLLQSNREKYCRYYLDKPSGAVVPDVAEDKSEQEQPTPEAARPVEDQQAAEAKPINAPVVESPVQVEEVTAEVTEAINPQPETVQKPSSPAEPVSDETIDDPLAGKGGALHKKMQNAIKKMASSLDFKTTIEKQTTDKSGWIDVVIEIPDGKNIAVEISVSTKATHELGNVKKCLSDGYDEVVVIAESASHLATLKKSISKKLGKRQQAQVQFFLPEQLTDYLKQIKASSMQTEKTTLGWKVNVSYSASESEAEAYVRRQTVARLIG